MPLYEYRCVKCGAQVEKIQKFADRSLTKCSECGGKLERMLSSPAIQFKGTGWYITDYARKSSAPGKEKGDGASPDKSEKGSTEKTTTPAPGENTKKKEPAPASTASESKSKNRK